MHGRSVFDPTLRRCLAVATELQAPWGLGATLARAVAVAIDERLVKSDINGAQGWSRALTL